MKMRWDGMGFLTILVLLCEYGCELGIEDEDEQM